MSTTKKCEHCGRELRLQTYESAKWWVDASIHRHSCDDAKDARIADLEEQLAELARLAKALCDVLCVGALIDEEDAARAAVIDFLATLDGAAAGETKGKP